VPASIEPGLFEFVDEFAKQVQGGEFKPDDKLDANFRIMVFCENFFGQFFANALKTEMEGFDQSAKRKAAGVALDRQSEKGERARATRALIAMFERFCDLYADALGGEYAEAAITLRYFHQEYLYKLLRRAEEWAKAWGDEALSKRIGESLERYTEAVGSQKW
jgi:hypothetical protein